MVRQFILFWVIFGLSACRPVQTIEQVQIKGSDSEVAVVMALAESFMNHEHRVSVSVKGGGSGSGIAALLNGKTDIANSSRDMSVKELEMAAARSIRPVPVVFAEDVLVFILHPSLQIRTLTLEQLAGIYRGDIRNWKEVGGPDREISLYGRQSNSGTYVYLREKILKAEYSSKVKGMNGTAQIVEAIKQDRGGIGYVSLGYVQHGGKPSAGISVIRIGSGEGVSPLDASAVASGLYPLKRPLYHFLNGPARGKLAAFLRFERSEQGKAIIRESGYIPVELPLALAPGAEVSSMAQPVYAK